MKKVCRGKKKIKILAIEDGENWWKYFRTIFDKRYYELYPVDRVEEAEDRLKEGHIDIVIVNIQLFKGLPSDKKRNYHAGEHKKFLLRHAMHCLHRIFCL